MKTHAQNTAAKTARPNFQTSFHTPRPRPYLVMVAMIGVIAAAVGLSSCAGYTTKAAAAASQGSSSGTGILSASAGVVDFGTVAVGSSATQTLTLTDTGTAPVAVSSVSVSGPGFSVAGGGFSGTVAVGQSVTVQFGFAPQAAGDISGSVAIVSDASSSIVANAVSSGMTANASSNGKSSFKLSLHGVATQPEIAMWPSSVSFSNATVGQSSTQSVALTNNGNANLQIKGATITGTGFSITGLVLPQTIPAGHGISFTVQYAPTSAGSASGSIAFSDNAPASPQAYVLTANAVTANGTLSANPGSYDFNGVAVGSSSKETITLTNSGGSAVTIGQVNTSGTGFSASGLTAGQTIAAGAQASFTAAFTPTAAGNASGAVTISTNASNSTLTIALGGTGTQAQLSVSPSAIAFNNVNVGSNASQTVTVTNSGTGAVSISAATITGSGYSTTLAPTTINAGANTTFSVTFAPTAEGIAAGGVSIISNAPGSPVTIAMTGTGMQAIGSANPASLAFGSVVIGNSNSDVITLQNTGNATLSFSQVSVSGSGFSISGLTTSSTIAAGGSLNFNAAFTPASAGSSTGSITLATNGSPSQLSISLTGTGATATESLSLSSSSLNFGNVQVGTNNSLTATLTNTGNSNVLISGMTVSGTGYAASGVASGMTLTPNQSVTLTINFAPTAVGSDPGTVSIASNATNPVTISLTGESHTVLLSWTASTSSGVTGYYVYRETQSGQYTKINPSSPASATQFTDTSVAAATTYYYVVTAVDSNGVESPYSTPATVSVP